MCGGTISKLRVEVDQDGFPSWKRMVSKGGARVDAGTQDPGGAGETSVWVSGCSRNLQEGRASANCLPRGLTGGGSTGHPHLPLIRSPSEKSPD